MEATSELLPEWVKITVSVPKLTDTMKGTPQWTAEILNYQKSTNTAVDLKVK